MQDQVLPILLKGSQYAKRMPIGTKESLETFTHDRLKRFYKDWYRPDLMAVVAVGDFDKAAVERMIKERFGPIPPALLGAAARRRFEVPVQPGTAFAIVTDKEMPAATRGDLQQAARCASRRRSSRTASASSTTCTPACSTTAWPN